MPRPFDPTATMKLLSWNVSGSGEGRAAHQLVEIEQIGPDVLALQAVRGETLDFWRDGLANLGYNVINSDRELLKVQGPLLPEKGEGVRLGMRRNLNLLAALNVIEPLEGLTYADPVEGFPEKYLVGRVEFDGRKVDIHNVHTPGGEGVDMLKVSHWEAMLERLAQPTESARVLCGDFNEPPVEQDPDVPPAKGKKAAEWVRWGTVTRGFLDHPELRDVYRANRVSGTPIAVSVTVGKGWTRRSPRRDDHIYASEQDFDLPQCQCDYLTQLMNWPEMLIDPGGMSQGRPDFFRNLSDHAPVLATLQLRG